MRTLLLILFALLALRTSAADRPNILWLIGEDLGVQLNCYGYTTEVSTPNLDALAKQGVRYSRAYTTAPVCSARNRSALLHAL